MAVRSKSEFFQQGHVLCQIEDSCICQLTAVRDAASLQGSLLGQSLHGLIRQALGPAHQVHAESPGSAVCNAGKQRHSRMCSADHTGSTAALHANAR